MVTKRLKKITQEEFEGKIKEHFYYVHGGDEGKRADFTDIDFSNLVFPQQTDLRGAIFDGSDFSKIKIPDINGGYQIGDKVYRAFCNGGDFRVASFRDVNFGDITLSGSNFTDAIFIGAKFNPLHNFQGFLDGIIVTEKELEQGRALLITEKRETNLMLDIFNELKRDFSHEERLWLIFGFYIFLVLFVIASALISLLSPIISAYANIVLVAILLLIMWALNSGKKNNYQIESGEYFVMTLILFSTFFPVVYFIHEAYIAITLGHSSWARIITGEIGLNQLENILPLSLVLFSILWFSVHQYGRAKKLRIEQQNKQAMIHFMQAVIAQDGKGSYAERSFPQLAPFFANAIIHRPFSQDNYDPQLPIDEVKKIVDIAKIFDK